MEALIQILLIEDSPHDAKLIERELRRAGLTFTIQRVHTERDLRAALSAGAPDVILGDYNLPGFDGIEALKIVREIDSATPFIFVSGSIGEERAVQALREGATDYVLKDRLTRLPSAITRALSECRERKLRQRAQAALVRSEERFHYAAKATQELIFDVDLIDKRIWFNESITTDWGWEPPTNPISLSWWLERVHPADRGKLVSLINQAIDEGQERWASEFRFVRPDGSYGYMSSCALIIRDRNGHAIRSIGSSMNVTDQKAAEEIIRRFSRQNRLILNSANEGLIAVDRNGKPFMVNPAAMQLTGFSEEEFLATYCLHDLIHHSRPDGTPFHRDECPTRRSILAGEERRGEDVYWRKSGESFPVDVSVSPIHEDSRIAGAVLIMRDITDRKRMQSQIEQANRVASLGRVAATIAHEFNNVLMGIQPFAELIRRNAKEEKLTKAASQIMNSVSRGKRVTQEILWFTQPSEPALQRVDLEQWLLQLIPELQATAGSAVRIVFEPPPERVFIECDSAQMQQVVANLILNARDAMPHGGTIKISVATSGGIPDGMVNLSVRDTGTGMPPHILENVFEPLFTTKRSGTGLGLAVVRQIITRHKGSIEAESKPGEGTVFRIYLPAVREVPIESKPVRRKASLRSLLLVEDDPVVAAGITELLESEGIRVRAIEEGAKAPEAVAEYQPDAVILDVTLPDTNGLAVYERIAERWPDLPVIFSTGHADEANLDADAERPHIGFLRKPYELETLLEMLDQVTTRR